MAFADSNRIALGLKEETNWGVWPVGGNLDEIRYTGETFGSQTSTAISNEVRSDRMVPDIIRTGIAGQGGYNGEVSYGVSAWEKIVGGVLGSADFAAPPAAITADLQFIASGNRVVTDSTGAGTDFSTTDFAPGGWVRISGATDNANNGYFQISARDTATASAHEITLVGGTLVDEAAASRTIQSSAVMRNGIVERSFSIEKQWQDLTTPLAARLLGWRVGSVGLTLPESGIFTYNTNGQGKQIADTAGSDLTDAGATLDFTTLANFDAAAANNVLSTADGIADIVINRDAPYDTVTMRSANFTMNTALRRQDALSAGVGAAGIGQGRFTVEGAAEFYFEDDTLFSAHLKYIDTDFAVAVRDGAGNAYLFDLPAVKFGGDGTPKGQGNDQDALISVSMQGKRSTRYGLNYQAAVHKFAA